LDPTSTPPVPPLDPQSIARLDEGLGALLEHGGPLMGLMLLVSVVVLTLALERLWALLRLRAMIRQADDRVVEALRQGELEEARRRAEQLGSPVREIFAAGLDRALGRARGEAGRSMARELRRAGHQGRRLLWLLGSMGALMPFVGLLGTVLGVMDSFRSIGLHEKGGFAVVSGGISEALVATAIGLGVALEAVLAYNVLSQTMGSALRDLGLLVDESGELLQWWSQRGGAHGDTPQP
jgi:biopolymer transport protein ExbB/TolQ